MCAYLARSISCSFIVFELLKELKNLLFLFEYELNISSLNRIFWISNEVIIHYMYVCLSMYLYIIYLSFKKEGKCFTETKKKGNFQLLMNLHLDW